MCKNCVTTSVQQQCYNSARKNAFLMHCNERNQNMAKNIRNTLWTRLGPARNALVKGSAGKSKKKTENPKYRKKKINKRKTSAKCNCNQSHKTMQQQTDISEPVGQKPRGRAAARRGGLSLLFLVRFFGLLAHLVLGRARARALVWFIFGLLQFPFHASYTTFSFPFLALSSQSRGIFIFIKCIHILNKIIILAALSLTATEKVIPFVLGTSWK